MNTAIAGLQITLPVTDRNQGNRAAAAAEVLRQQELLAATEAEVRADYFGALQEYQLRRNEVVETLQPLREHADTISEIAQAAYAQGGTELLRLLDAEGAQLDAELAYVQGMMEYQQIISNLQAAGRSDPMMKSGVIFLLFSSETLRRLKHLAYPPLARTRSYCCISE